MNKSAEFLIMNDRIPGKLSTGWKAEFSVVTSPTMLLPRQDASIIQFGLVE